MFEVMAMEHINTLLLKLHSYFYCLIRLYGNSIFPALLIFRWFFSISGKDCILSPVNMKWMDHPSHFIRLIINFPYFGIPLFLGEINSVRIKLLPIYRYFIHHSRSEEHTSELQSRFDLVCRLLLDKKKLETY